jgi:hypothetical protein
MLSAAAAVLSCGLAHADDAPLLRAQALVIEALSGQRQARSRVAYTETAEDSDGAVRRFDWVVNGNIPDGDWRMRARLPSRRSASGSREQVFTRIDDAILRGSRTDDHWSAVIYDFDPGILHRNTPSASYWYLQDGRLADEFIGRFRPLAAEISPDVITLTLPTNERVLEVVSRPGGQVAGHIGDRLVFSRVGGSYHLTERDLLVVVEDGAAPATVDDWRGVVAGFPVGRMISWRWEDFRAVGGLHLPFRWSYRTPTFALHGGILEASVTLPDELACEEAIALRVPSDWTGPGSTRDRRTGELVEGGVRPAALSPPRLSPRASESGGGAGTDAQDRDGVVWAMLLLAVGGAILVIAGARRARRPAPAATPGERAPDAGEE